MSDESVELLRGLIARGEVNQFYTSTAWRHLRDVVLRLDRYECQCCKARGRYRRAVIVHHVKHVRERPDLALSIWDGEERQLVSVCADCHRELHPEMLRQCAGLGDVVTVECWD